MTKTKERPINENQPDQLREPPFSDGSTKNYSKAVDTAQETVQYMNHIEKPEYMNDNNDTSIESEASPLPHRRSIKSRSMSKQSLLDLVKVGFQLHSIVTEVRMLSRHHGNRGSIIFPNCCGIC